MALNKKKKAKPKKAAVEMTLWDVILSYPDLHNPKPYKNNTYYKTDALLDPDHPQLKDLKRKIKQVCIETWGEDQDEWPEGATRVNVKNGDEREDQPTYHGKYYITATKNAEFGQPPVVDPKGKVFNPQQVKGGMFANIAIRIASWKPDESTGESEGLSIFLEGVQIDTSKASLNFGGGKSVKQMFSRNEDEDESDDEDHDADEDEDDEDDQPRSKKKKRPTVDEDDEDEEE